MIDHPALKPGRVAVITGAAGGIGLAAAKTAAALGMDVWMIDISPDVLNPAAEQVRAAAASDVTVTTQSFDVSGDMGSVCSTVREHHGHIGLLMNNAGVGGGGDVLAPREHWDRVLGVNLIGVLNGVQAFLPSMLAQGSPALIVNTGSKQGITTPPGDTAYNVSKAGVKALTEGLQHTLRNTPGCQISAHLLIPGFVWTGLTARGRTEKPDGAWTPEQTMDFAFARIVAGDFYILCPDGETDRALDEKRMAWAMGDIIENRPPLSRWHPDHAEAFKAYLADGADG